MYFSQDWRERMKQENPEASFGTSLSLPFQCHQRGLRAFGLGAGELGKLLGNKWKELDDDEKKVRLSSFTRPNSIHARCLLSLVLLTSIAVPSFSFVLNLTSC
jgi:hypothetical protein